MPELQRTLSDKLLAWAKKPKRAPLLLLGARRTGKTRLMHTLGLAFSHCAAFSLSQDAEAARAFDGTREPRVILDRLRAISPVPIVPGETLLLLDDIEASETALGSLKYFADSFPDLALIAAANHLGAAVRERKIFLPVGAVEIERVRPLTFSEFLLNVRPALREALARTSLSSPLPAFLRPDVESLFRTYLTVGGFPEAVSAYLDTGSIEAADVALKRIEALIRDDFSRYASKTDTKRLTRFWEAMPAELMRNGPHFRLNAVVEKAKSREYHSILQRLVDDDLVGKVTRVSRPTLPLAAYRTTDALRLTIIDPGLLRIMAGLTAGLAPDVWDDAKDSDPARAAFRHAASESYLANALAAATGSPLFAWKSEAGARIDLLLQAGLLILPIENLVGEARAGRSLKLFQKKFDLPLALRFDESRWETKETVVTLPAYMAESLPRLIKESEYFTHETIDF